MLVGQESLLLRADVLIQLDGVALTSCQHVKS
jgi:hypothetical protein